MERATQEPSPWEAYYQRTREKPPRELLVRALEYTLNRGAAIDVGAGSLRDTRYLLQAGFKKVVALDQEPLVAEYVAALGDSRAEAVTALIEAYDFPRDTFDLINAQHALPFVAPHAFHTTLERVRDALAPSGILTGTLFGTRHQWSTDPRMSFHSAEAVYELISTLGLETLECREVEEDERSAQGTSTHWHTFQLITRNG